MKQICQFILFLPTFFFISCSFHTVNKYEVPWLEMEKTSCRGQCPEYKVSFYSKARAIYQGYAHAPRSGKYYTKLSEEKMKRLRAMVVEAKLDSCRDSYISLRTDLPTTYIRYTTGGDIRTITDYDNAPEGLRKFEEELENLTESLSWRKSR